ncbi:MAG: hypothetical protein EOO27_07045 [Comamonadaceae bacterium]|nr:MAG: hypothetical protein EOO27_07045 [Comamonadaceae bacterium]
MAKEQDDFATNGERRTIFDDWADQGSSERREQLVALSIKLDALLAFTYGESGEAFRNLHGDVQDAYLWACSDMAGEIKGLVHG